MSAECETKAKFVLSGRWSGDKFRRFTICVVVNNFGFTQLKSEQMSALETGKCTPIWGEQNRLLATSVSRPAQWNVEFQHLYLIFIKRFDYLDGSICFSVSIALIENVYTMSFKFTAIFIVGFWMKNSSDPISVEMFLFSFQSLVFIPIYILITNGR